MKAQPHTIVVQQDTGSINPRKLIPKTIPPRELLRLVRCKLFHTSHCRPGSIIFLEDLKAVGREPGLALSTPTNSQASRLPGNSTPDEALRAL